MPYCSYCGYVVEADARFCDRCGKPTNLQHLAPSAVPAAAPNASPYASPYANPYAAPSPIQQQARTRTESLYEINRIVEYFGRKQPQYEELSQCFQKIDYFKNTNSRIVEPISGTKSTVPFYVTGGICIWLALLSLIIGAMIKTNAYSHNDGLAYFLFFLAAGLVAGGIVLMNMGAKVSSHNSKLYKEKREAILKQYTDRLYALSEEIYYHYQNYGYCAVGLEYTFPSTLQRIKNNIDFGRADTIKEAISVMLMDAHLSEMQLQASITSQAAVLAAQSAASAARSSRATAILMGASILFR